MVRHEAHRFYDQSRSTEGTGSAQASENQSAMLGETLRFLARGRHVGADKLLDWLVRDDQLDIS